MSETSASSSAPALSRPARRLAVVSLTVAYFTMGTGLMSVVGLLDPMALAWQVDQSDVALLLTVFSLIFALAAPAIQVIFSRLTLRTLLLAGLVIMALGAVGLAFSTNYSSAIVWRIVMALGAAAVGPVATAIATSITPPAEQVRTLATLFSGMTLSSVIGVPLATWIGQQMSWSFVFLLVAAMSVACAVVLSRTVRRAPVGRQLSLRDFVGVFVTADTRYAVMTTWLHMTGQFVCYALIALLFVSLYGLPAQWLWIALFAMGIGHLIGTVFTGVFGDRFEANALINFSLIGMAAVFAGLALSTRPEWLVGTLFFAWSVIGSVFQPPQQKRLIALNPQIRPLLLAMNASALYLGIAFGSALATAIDHFVGLRALPVSAALVTALALACSYASRRANQE